jgi:hypothetical protein
MKMSLDPTAKKRRYAVEVGRGRTFYLKRAKAVLFHLFSKAGAELSLTYFVNF